MSHPEAFLQGPGMSYKAAVSAPNWEQTDSSSRCGPQHSVLATLKCCIWDIVVEHLSDDMPWVYGDEQDWMDLSLMKNHLVQEEKKEEQKQTYHHLILAEKPSPVANLCLFSRQKIKTTRTMEPWWRPQIQKVQHILLYFISIDLNSQMLQLQKVRLGTIKPARPALI